MFHFFSRFYFVWFFCSFTLVMSTHGFAASDLLTLAEKTAWKQTGRADETENLCKRFQAHYPARIKCETYGTTPEGRNLKVLILGDRSTAARKNVVWVQAGIHAGEIDGKDAMFLLLREILQKKISPDPLAGLTLVFVPIVNLDGHERFGKWNRPNQVGPEEMGWRTTSQNLNMNRDFTKVEAPETQALLKLWSKYQPAVSVDLHVTDGANFQPEVGITVSPANTGTEGPYLALRKLAKELEVEIISKLTAKNHLALSFYPDLKTPDRPSEGFKRSQSTPRFADGYWALQNRIGILVEAHSWKNYANRVNSQHDTVLAILELAQKNIAAWNRAEHAIDQNKIASQMVDLEYETNDHQQTIEFPGYHYTETTHSPISGGHAIRYDDQKPEIWKVPFYDTLVAKLSLKAPKQGYFVPPSEAVWMRKKLELHGIRFSEMKKSVAESEIEVFRATQSEAATQSYEGRQRMSVKGEWKTEKHALSRGTLFVPIDQPKARMAMTLLEPSAQDSFLSWGYFNTAFEQKEYMEDYAIEIVAKEMLESNSAIKTEFEKKLKDKEFANDADKRLQFFYQKHPSYDQRFNRYAVFRK